MELYVIGAIAFLGALLIKLKSRRKARDLETESFLKANSKKHRLEPKASLPRSEISPIRYCVKQSFLSNTEQAFYNALRIGLEDQFIILIKVRVCDVLQPQSGILKTEWQNAFNRISSKHFDFVLFTYNEYEPVAAIELDDSSLNHSRKNRDKFLNETCESANFPLIRITARQIYTAQEIKSAILSAVREYWLKKAA